MIGLAWAAPVAQQMQGVPFLNWATLLFVPVLMFYLSLGWRSFLAMLFLFAVCGLICIGIEDLNLHLGWTATGVFVIAWIGRKAREIDRHGHRGMIPVLD